MKKNPRPNRDRRRLKSWIRAVLRAEKEQKKEDEKLALACVKRQKGEDKSLAVARGKGTKDFLITKALRPAVSIIPRLDGERRRAIGERKRDFENKTKAYNKSLYEHAKKFAALPAHLQEKHPELVWFSNRRRLQKLLYDNQKRPSLKESGEKEDRD